MLWLPIKIRKYLRILKSLIDIYRLDYTLLKPIIKQPKKRKKDNFSYKTYEINNNSFGLEFKQIVAYNRDNLKYHSKCFKKKYLPDSIFKIFEYNTNFQLKISIASMLSEYLDKHYVSNSILEGLRDDLKKYDLLSIIDKPYYDYLKYHRKNY